MENIHIVDDDANWPRLYAAERELILQATDSVFAAIEHIGSTAIPGLPAKPIIDMMAAVLNLDAGRAAVAPLGTLGYHLVETGMPNRLLLRKQTSFGYGFNLHIVEYSTWAERNERLLRDYMLAHPDAVQAYGQLKQQLATAHANDGPAYTRAKTAFIQSIVDMARAARGLPNVSVWEE